MELNRREAINLGLIGVGGLLFPFDLSNSALAQTISDCPECLRGKNPPPTFPPEELSHQIIHFVDWQILDRNGRKPRAYELGWKDVFRVNHFETVRVIAKFGRRSGDFLE